MFEIARCHDLPDNSISTTVSGGDLNASSMDRRIRIQEEHLTHDFFGSKNLVLCDRTLWALRELIYICGCDVAGAPVLEQHDKWEQDRRLRGALPRDE